jgi:MFS family permease
LPARLLHVRTFESLHIRDYRLLWLGQTGTSMGQWMDQVSRGWLMYHITGSALQLGGVSAMRAVPMILFGVAAGVVADRYGRKAQLIISQVTNVLLNLTLATLVLTGLIQPWHLYVTALFAGTVQAFQQPARQSLISELVGKRHLTNAIALNSAVLNLSRSIGPAIAGALIAVIGVDGSYYAQAGLYGWATIWTMQMNVPGEPGRIGRLGSALSRAPAGQPSSRTDGSTATAETDLPQRPGRRPQVEGSFFGSMKEGLRYVATNDLILSLMMLGLAPVLLGMPYASLMPVFALDVLQVGSVGQGILLMSAGLGALIGALFIASLRSFRRKGMLMLGGAMMFGLSLIAFSRSTWMPLSMLCLFLAGMSNTSYTSQDQTIIQTIAPDHMRGRVLSIYLLNRGLMPLGSLLAGALASWLGGPSAVLLMGMACTAIALIVAIRTPRIRQLDI